MKQIIVVHTIEDIKKRLSEEAFSQLIKLEELDFGTVIEYPLKMENKYGYDISYELNELILKERTLQATLENLNLTNDSNIELNEAFTRAYDSYIKMHKDSQFKYLKNQKVVDSFALGLVLQRHNLSTCNYTNAIVTNVISMKNGYFKRTA